VFWGHFSEIAQRKHQIRGYSLDVQYPSKGPGIKGMVTEMVLLGGDETFKR
jgi:hypothetical protein